MSVALSDPGHSRWMADIEAHANWVGRASAALSEAAFDPEASEMAIAHWTRVGHRELGPEVNLHTLLSCLKLAPAPSGTAADARLRRRRALSEAVFGAVLRAKEWQEDVLYLCSGADGLLLVRLHFRTLTLMESEEWQGSILVAAQQVVSDYIVAHGLDPVEREIPTMEQVQRKSYKALSRSIDALLAESGTDCGAETDVRPVD